MDKLCTGAQAGRHVTDGESERVTVDNVCRGQESTFSKMTQNEIRKNLRLVLYRFRDTKSGTNKDRHTHIFKGND